MKIIEWELRDMISTLSGVVSGDFKRRRPYMSLLRYYVGKLNLTPRFDTRVEDVLSAAFSVYEIKDEKNSRGKDISYVIFSATDFRHVLDVTRVFRANGILGRLCYKDV